MTGSFRTHILKREDALILYQAMPNNFAPLDIGGTITNSVTATGAFATAAGRITVPAATFTTDPVTGEVTSVPGTSTLTVTGTV